MVKHIFIIEHLEPELYAWCIIEYKNISKIVGKENLYFTNIKREDINKLKEYGKVFSESVKTMKLENSCILDPESNETLTTQKAAEIDFFIFGGILGDNPPKKRTEIELTRFIKNHKTYNIEKKQMSTDNAVLTVKRILNGENIKEMKFQDKIEIKIDDIMTTILPYRYPLVNGKPQISQELVDFIKKRDKV